MTSIKPILLKIATLLAYLVMVGVNYLAVSLPLGGRSTGQISDDYQNLFAPAGYAFSIWGLIYILLGIYAVYQLRRREDNLVDKVNILFVVNALLNASWIVAWHYDLIGLSVIIMGGILITLIRIVEIFRGRTMTPKEKWLVRLPFLVYFGWITVATMANVTVLFVYIDWNRLGLSDVFWTVAVLLVGALIGTWSMFRHRFVAYGLVLIWAYSAILVKHISASAYAGKYPAVIWITALCLLLFSATLAFIVLNTAVQNKLK